MNLFLAEVILEKHTVLACLEPLCDSLVETEISNIMIDLINNFLSKQIFEQGKV